MNETVEKIKAWVTANPLLAAGAAVALFMVAKPLFKARRRRRRSAHLTVAYRRRSHKKAVRRSYRLGSRKPAWMVKGSRAARLHMARIRRRRRA